MKFSKISKEMFRKTFPCYDEANFQDIYDSILIPRRATAGSVGYDFKAIDDIMIKPKETVHFPTGIRVELNQGYFLLCVPRSGLGFKYGLRLLNTVGIIDSDYFHSDNEGQIFAKFYNPSEETITIKKGSGYMQGIILQCFITEDDEPNLAVRNGGFGSTDGR